MKTINLLAAMQFAVVLATAGEVKTEFEGSAVLSDQQIRIVTELALRAGLPTVARIYTYNIHPGSSFGINVVSNEEMKGREGTSSCLSVGYEKWEPGGRKHEKVKLRSGDFWVRPWIIKARFGVFSGPRAEVKISLSDNTTLEMADRVFDLFKAGKVRFRTHELKAKVAIAVRHAHAGMGLDCTIEEGEIVVIEVNQVIS
jgi:hypothetical protein